MKKLFLIISQVLITLQLFALPEAALPLLQVPLLDVQVCIDGSLDEPAWKQAGCIEKLGEVLNGEAVDESTKIFIWADGEALYLGWICVDSEIHATFTERDSEFWLEEVVELFLATSGLNRYFELQWNPLGGTFDAIIDNKIGKNGRSLGIKGDWSLTAANMRWAVNNDTDNQVWTVEAAIPFKDLDQDPPEPGTVWHANFYRVNDIGNDQHEHSSWSPILGSGFHQPLRFGRLVFFEATESEEDQES